MKTSLAARYLRPPCALAALGCVRGARQHQHGGRGDARERAARASGRRSPRRSSRIARSTATSTTPEALTRVKGIGARIVEMNRANILVADPPRAEALTACHGPRSASRSGPGPRSRRGRTHIGRRHHTTSASRPGIISARGHQEVSDATDSYRRFPGRRDEARASCPRPRRRRRRCCRSSTSR